MRKVCCDVITVDVRAGKSRFCGAKTVGRWVERQRRCKINVNVVCCMTIIMLLLMLMLMVMVVSMLLLLRTQAFDRRWN